MTKRRIWYTIVFPGQTLDLEEHGPYRKLVLFETKGEAEEDVAMNQPGAEVAKIRLELRRLK